VLVVLFLVLQAPDVALSELVVGAVGFPLAIVVVVSLERKR
jgi:energy-converting hydrogenase B subunit D